MSKIDNSIYLGIGNISYDQFLGKYYQDFSPAIIRITKKGYAELDGDGLPMHEGLYLPVIIIQYGLICYDLLLSKIDVVDNTEKVQKCINWLEKNKTEFKDSFVWESRENKQYHLNDGWVSGMYQGQAISLYLRAYQLFNNPAYLESACKIFNSFKYDYSEGGFKRIDNNGYIWFEEYPTPEPSYVLNGFCYAIFGILDLYRVTRNIEIKQLWDSCIITLENNLHKYDVWYWSLYDQQKKELVSYYYQKNVHIPLLLILAELTQKNIFKKYANKWQRNLNGRFYRIITKIMYRVKPRIKILFNG